MSDISIEKLLAGTDLEGDKRKDGVLSLLCCDVLDDIVDSAFSIDGPVKSRNWIGRGDDRSLRVRLTLTNIRGVPYSFPIFGANQPERFGMLNHADFYDFAIGPAAATTDATGLDSNHYETPDWSVLKSAALATGAFPVGLRPRMISRPNANWYSQSGAVGYEDTTNQRFVSFGPDPSFAEAPYSFVSVDGGTIDNEPLELARRYLAGSALHNKQDGDQADKAIVLIAPFPSFVKSPPPDSAMKLTHVFPLLLNGLIQQARFKPDELEKAANDTIFSRFMISPTRQGNGSPEAKLYPIACGAMGGFSGFLHESFRRHDYLLGRRNAQAFLRWNFALPETNDLFAGVNINRDRWLVRDADGQQGSIAPGADHALAAKTLAPKVNGAATAKGYPIIPLSDRLCAPIEIGPADRPRPDLISLDDLKGRVQQRAQAVAEVLVDVDLAPLLASMNRFEAAGVSVAARAFGAHIATEAAIKVIAEAQQELVAAFA